MDLSMMGFDGSDWRGSKMGKTEDYSSVSSSKQMLRSNSSLSDEQNMLSFSMTDSKTGGFGLFNNTSSGYYTNTGYGCGGGLSVRGPFTPSQWMELEHQALIYKYILSNVPVPSNLLFPIKKALDSAGFSIGPLRPNTYGWGAFHLGFSSNTDPEPGRCRRTDGKKWRCSRDACPDQKYCERHINRGRHRSRKPVEAQIAHSFSIATSAKLAVPGASFCRDETIPLKSLQQCGPNSGESSLNMNMNFVNKDIPTERTQAATDLSMFSSGINLKNNQFSNEKKQNPCNESEFGLVFSDSLLNPFHKTPSETLKEKSSQGSVHQFIDEWPKNQLITSLSTEEKLAFSPLRLSSTDLNINEQNNRQTNWVPISWETSIGGPLAEALHNTNQTSFKECNNTIGLVSSPNGPLQRMAFRSQTNSSASSPRGGASSLAQLL